VTTEERLEHALKALSTIVIRCEGIARPNGTTKVIDRIANAGITGDSIEDAAARLVTRGT
jgi:hypothetical protein